MPSAWDRIGANWLDLRNIRTEPVINEIYKATVERDYWLKLIQGDTVTAPNYPLVNTSYQLRYIYIAFERWFKPLSIVSNGLLSSGYYIYEDGSPTSDPVDEYVDALQFSTPYGKTSYDYVSGGNLSTLVNYDMSFLNVGIPNGRVNIEHLQIFYKVLNLNLKNRMFRLSKNNSGYFSDSQRSNTFVDMYQTEDQADTPQTANQTVTEVNNFQDEADGTFVNFRMRGLVYYSRYGAPTELYTGEFRRYQISLDNHTIENFDINCYYRVWEDKDAGFSASYSPVVGNYIQGGSFRTINVLNQGGAQKTVYDPLPEILFTTINGGDINDSIRVNTVPQNFININNEEILSYYTAP